jgi:hypothetical protein
MCRVRADMSAHFLKVHGIDTASDLQRLIEPLAEAQIAHATALEAAWPEFRRAVDDAAPAGSDSPAGGGGAQIEGKDARGMIGGLGHDDLLFGLAAGAKPLSGEGGASPGPERGLVWSVGSIRQFVKQDFDELLMNRFRLILL